MTAAGGRTFAQNAGLVAGIAALVATLLVEPPAGMSPAAWIVAGTMVLMACWWATEALPLAATALVPLAILPPLGATSAADLAQGYGNTTLFLILGGLLLGLAMERCNLHRRIAYAIVARAGGHAQGLVLGMMCATAFVSMWVQNTSTTLMMIPVALSVATIVAPEDGATGRDAANFAKAIVLCVAYAATIGGLGTLVGTATNALVVGFMQQSYGETISFTRVARVRHPDRRCCSCPSPGLYSCASHSRSGSASRRRRATAWSRRASRSGRCPLRSGACRSSSS